MQALFKILLSALLIFGISELAKRSSLLGALLASLPLTSILAVIWLYRETGDVRRIADLAGGIFWLVLPSLVFFLLLPALLVRWQIAFPWALAIACGATAVSYGLLFVALRRLGLHF